MAQVRIVRQSQKFTVATRGGRSQDAMLAQIGSVTRSRLKRQRRAPHGWANTRARARCGARACMPYRTWRVG